MPVAQAVMAPPPPPPPPTRYRQPHEEFVGLLSFAFFLTAVAVVFGLNPNLVTDLRLWTQIVSDHHTVFVRPPDPVLVSAAWFFGVMGVLEFVNAGVRWALRWTPLRSAGRVLSAVGDLMFASLLQLYAIGSITGAFLVTILVGVLAVLLMIYVTLGIYWSNARTARWLEFAQNRTQP